LILVFDIEVRVVVGMEIVSQPICEAKTSISNTTEQCRFEFSWIRCRNGV